ncbi:MAG TPA: zinc-binding dehydrogenase [Lacisediminihabitans sp.]|jgi:NADPH2:quinone reductase|nr:zinc-binding dehydrogenase [Lacisediminihabitans sp.]HXD60636.1 zinc-binding dehydrogenase [Lacisediminihabitans sp.]
MVRFVPDAVAIGGKAVAGTIDAVGHDVIGFASGDRVASLGAREEIAEVQLLDSENLIGIPRDVSAEQAAALLPQGLVARVLVKEAHAVGGRETVLVHAAAGALGSLVVAWAKSLGATVIATVGSAESRSIAARAGADRVIVFGDEDVAERVREYTDGRGVDVVYDGVGAATWESSLGSLRRGGELVLCGRAAEAQHGAEAARELEVTILRPRVPEHLRGGSIQQGAADLFLAIRSGVFDGVEVEPLVRHPRSVALAA